MVGEVDTPLFPTLPKQPSPRLAWMEREGVTTHHNPKCREPWCAWIGTHQGDFETLARYCILMETDGRLAYGKTENEALLALIAGGRVKHWNLS